MPKSFLDEYNDHSSNLVQFLWDVCVIFVLGYS